jgi:hypothetical protein
MVAIEAQKCVVRVVEIYVTVDNITILSVAQQYFYDKFMSLATTERTSVFKQSVRHFCPI